MHFGFDGIDPRREAEKDRAIWAFIWQWAPAVGLIYIAPIIAGVVAGFAFSFHPTSWIEKALCWLIGGVALVGGVAAIIVGMYLINWIGKITSAYCIGMALAEFYCELIGTRPQVSLKDFFLGFIAVSAVSEIVRNFIAFFLPGRESS
jgi:hypothetical protein